MIEEQLDAVFLSQLLFSQSELHIFIENLYEYSTRKSAAINLTVL